MNGLISLLGVRVNCKEVNRALASSQPLSLKKRILVWAHLRICSMCRKVERHFSLLGDGFRALCAAFGTPTPERVRKLEEKIIRELKK